MTIVTPIDGEPAIAEHVAQLTETLTGVRAEPITLRSPLAFLPQDGAGATQTISNPTGDALRFSNNVILPGGDLILEQVHLQVAINGESYERASMDYRSLTFGDGTANPGTGLYFSTPGALRMIGSFNPYTNNAYDLGATAARWRKAWAVDGEFTNVPTVGGVALPTSAGIASTYLPLTGGTLTGNLGVGITPSAWGSTWRALQFGQSSGLVGDSAYHDTYLLSNAYHDGSVWRSVVSATAIRVNAGGGNFAVAYAPSPGGAGVTLAFATRLNIIGSTGTVALTPAAGSPAISIGGTAQPKVTVASGAPSSPMTGDLWIW